MDYFKYLICDEKWTEAIESYEPNNSFTLLINIFIYHFNIAFPVKKNEVKANNIIQRWITKGLIVSRNKLQILRKIKRTQCLSGEFLEYIQTYQRIFRKVLIEARRKESNRYVLASKNKSKALWKLINKESGKTQQNQNTTIRKGHNFITNPRMIAESFNRYFIDIVENLLLQRNKYRSTIKSATPTQSCTATMFAAPVTEKEMERVIVSLNKKASAGCDEIPMLVLKQCRDYIVKPLVHICNLSFQRGIFPDQMKIAKIKPLHKNGDKHNMQNYRPISVLSAF